MISLSPLSDIPLAAKEGKRQSCTLGHTTYQTRQARQVSNSMRPNQQHLSGNVRMGGLPLHSLKQPRYAVKHVARRDGPGKTLFTLNSVSFAENDC